MKKFLNKLIASVLAATMTITALSFTSFASETGSAEVQTVGNARKIQDVLFASGSEAMQLNTTKTTVNGNLYSGGNLDAYSGEVDVRGSVCIGGELKKHDYTVWNSYRFADNAGKRELNDFSDAIMNSLSDEYITHEYWQTYSNPEIENEGNIYAKSGLQFCGNDVTLSGTIISENNLMISASHALNTAENSEMNLYVADGNIGIYVGDAIINGIIYAPNGTVQLCGSDIEINGMIIAREILISAENFVINENTNLSLAQYVKNYSSQILAAYADYDIESNLFNVHLFSTLNGGTYSIYTSLDGENFELNGTTNKNNYHFEINEKVPILYIKVAQTLDDGFVLNSNIVKMIADEDYGYVMEQTDTDGDGLTDLYEHIFGSNKDVEDTDGDGLSDYIEVMIIGTDPLYKDTDENGIDDGDEDFDGDGLTNLQELDYGTDLTLKDTDSDGFTDYEEIFVYGTDPLNPDTDGDGVNDGDEVALGLDPLSADSDNNGVSDNKEIFAQNIDNSDLDAINDGNAYKLTIDITAAGYANNSAIIDNSGFSYIATTNPSVLGKVINIDYPENLKVDSAVLKFEIPSYTVDSTRNYPDSLELAGLNRYAVFHYSKEYNIMYPVSVEYDEASSTLKVNANELGDYFVVDLDQWFYEMDIVPDQEESVKEISMLSLDYNEEICYTDSYEAVSGYTMEELEEIFDFSQPFGAVEISLAEQPESVYALYAAPRKDASFTAEKKIKPVDVAFIIDCTDNLQDNFENVKNNIIEASEEIFAMCNKAQISIIQFWSSKNEPVISDWYANSDITALKGYINSIEQSVTTGNSLHGEALKKAVDLKYRADAQKFNFLIFDEYSQWSADDTGDEAALTVQKILNKNINFSIFYDHDRTTIYNNFVTLIGESNGYDGNNQGDFYNDICRHIYDRTDKINTSVEQPEKPIVPPGCSYVDVSGNVVLGNFSRKCIYAENIYDDLDRVIIKDGYYGDDYNYNNDFDDDGLSNSDEVDWSGLKQNGLEFICRTYGEWRILIEKASTAGISYTLLNTKVLTVFSNPWEKDSDGDGIDDGRDAFKLDKKPLGYQKKYNQIVMSIFGEHEYKFIAPENGYYRFELYDRNSEFDINFINNVDDSKRLTGEVKDASIYYSDTRIYQYLASGDEIRFVVDGTENKKYNLFVTKATAYLCGGKFADGLDTSLDITILSGLMRAYGFDVIRYEGDSFKDVYEYTNKDKSPFGATHSEVVVICSHGEEGSIVDYSMKNTYIPNKESTFSQNILTLFACCFSSADHNLGSVIQQCVNAGAQTAVGFSHSIYDEESLYYSCEFFYTIFSGRTVETAIGMISKDGLFEPEDLKRASVGIAGIKKQKWFYGLRFTNDGDSIIDYTDIDSVIEYARKLYKANL